MAEFYVHREPQPDTSHLVHDKDCGEVITTGKFMYLGSYSTAEAAFKKATGLYDPVDYCPNCLAKNH